MMTLIIWLLLATSVQATELIWEYGAGTVAPTATVQRSATETGPFTDFAVIPSLPARYQLPPDAFGVFKIMTPGGASNTVQYFPLTVDTGVQALIDALTARVAAMESLAATLQREAVNLHQTDQAFSVMFTGDQDDIDALQRDLSALKLRVDALVQPVPVPTGNLTIRQLDGNRVEIACANSTSMRTTGSGLRRIVECLP